MAPKVNCFIEVRRLREIKDQVLSEAPVDEKSDWENAFEHLVDEISASNTLEKQVERYRDLCDDPLQIEKCGDLMSMWGLCLAHLNLDVPPRPPGK